MFRGMLILVLGMLTGCQTDGPDEFEFRYDDVWTNSYSIRFTRSDTVFLRQHFAGETSGPERTSATSYRGILSQPARLELDSLLQAADLTNDRRPSFFPKSTAADESFTEFYYRKGALRKRIAIHGDEAPVEILALRNWINRQKNVLKLVRVDSVLVFRGLSSRADLENPKVHSRKEYLPPPE